MQNAEEGWGDCKNSISKLELISLYKMGYTFGKKIGEGSTASVFMAQHIDGPRSVTVACKVYVESNMSKEFRRKFMPRELSILYSLDHDNIIRLHSIVKGRGYLYLFTDYAEQGDLFDQLSKNGPPCEDTSRLWFQQIVEGLKYLHRKEVAHRDLKCENILIAANGVIKLADFGFTRYCIDVRGERIKSDTYCGSTAYAAPEIIRGIPYDPKAADMWSLGVVLFAVVNSSLPFTESDPRKLYRDQLSRSWKYCRSDVPQGAQPLIKAMLDPSPKTRLNIEQISAMDWLKVGRTPYSRRKKPKSV